MSTDDYPFLKELLKLIAIGTKEELTEDDLNEYLEELTRRYNALDSWNPIKEWYTTAYGDQPYEIDTQDVEEAFEKEKEKRIEQLDCTIESLEQWLNDEENIKTLPIMWSDICQYQ